MQKKIRQQQNSLTDEKSNASNIESLITDNIDTWTSAIKKKSASGRGSSKKIELYGIKKLRELILELAVRGKLVPQDPSDEPASVLLEKNFEEQARLIVDESLKTKANKAIFESDEYLVTSSSWGKIKLGNLAKFIDYRGKTPKKLDSGVRLITAKNVKFGFLSLKPEEFISQDEYSTWMTRGFPRIGDILFTPEAPLGNVAQVDLEEIFALAQRAICFQLHIPEVSNFLRLFLISPIFQKLLKEKATGTTAKGIKASVLKELLVYLPSQKEQHRIVAKVDELMLLCDQLEQQTESSIDAHKTLVEVLLTTLTDSKNAKELNQNWTRVSEFFDTLFTTEHSIDQLKQTILQLAVMGKLVPQNENDEPASKLLERIAEHQAIRIKNKEIQKPKKVIAKDQLDLELPKYWKSILLNELVFVTKLAGFEYTKHIKLEDYGEVPVIRAQNVRPFTPSLENLKYISTDISSNLPRSALDRPSLLITFIGAGIGDICVFNKKERWHLAPNVAKVEPYADLNLEFLCLYLNSPLGKKEIFKSMKSTAQPSISMTTIREIWVGLPPCEEQVRIANKVKELMTICDQLKSRLNQSQQTQLHLADAIIDQAV